MQDFAEGIGLVAQQAKQGEDVVMIGRIQHPLDLWEAHRPVDVPQQQGQQREDLAVSLKGGDEDPVGVQGARGGVEPNVASS